MTDPAQTKATGQVAVIPTPSCIRSRRTAGGRTAGERASSERADDQQQAGDSRSGSGQPESARAKSAQSEPTQPDSAQLDLAQPGQGPRAAGAAVGGSARAAVREMLDSALAGLRLSCRDSHFLSRLVHWDKRNAATAASLMLRARQAGREEAELTPRQRDIIIAALHDAAVYRASGAASHGCWDCQMVPGDRCAVHARDGDRVRSYAEVEAVLSFAADVFPTQAELIRPRDIAGYRRRTPVAS
jgi:hypothetical protein